MDDYYEWNTGRLYSKEGQVIRAKVFGFSKIAFADLARGIEGIINAVSVARVADDEAAVRELVMQGYDGGFYAYPESKEEQEVINLLRK